MNLRSFPVVIGLGIGLTATVAALQTSPGGRETATKVHAESVTLTGCVAQGIDAEHYVLANAVRREDPPSSAAVAGTSKKVRSDQRGASDRTGPYDLEGGEFKAHLGHTVEVTGTSASTGKTANATSESAGARKPLPKFNVLSVKMLSATCT
jgi:hypothetical protein